MGDIATQNSLVEVMHQRHLQRLILERSHRIIIVPSRPEIVQQAHREDRYLVRMLRNAFLLVAVILQPLLDVIQPRKMIAVEEFD